LTRGDNAVKWGSGGSVSVHRLCWRCPQIRVAPFTRAGRAPSPPVSAAHAMVCQPPVSLERPRTVGGRVPRVLNNLAAACKCEGADIRPPLQFAGTRLNSCRRGTTPAEGNRCKSRLTGSLAGAPMAPVAPEQGKRSLSQEWRQQLASSWFSPTGMNNSSALIICKREAICAMHNILSRP
jgi:hypothetical protein